MWGGVGGEHGGHQQAATGPGNDARSPPVPRSRRTVAGAGGAAAARCRCSRGNPGGARPGPAGGGGGGGGPGAGGGVPGLTQHGLHGSQGAVVGLGGDAQQLAEEGVDVDAFEGLDHQPLLEGRSHGAEDGFHVHGLVVETVLAFVELDLVSLKGREGMWVPKPFSPLPAARSPGCRMPPPVLLSRAMFRSLNGLASLSF